MTINKSILSAAIIVAMFLFPTHARAWEYRSTESTTAHALQIRVGAEFTKKWDCGVHLKLAEDLRVDLYEAEKGTSGGFSIDTIRGINLNKSYTTLDLSYSPIKYLKFDVGYTLKILGRKDWSDYNEWLRHRLFFSITGSYEIGVVKLSLRERAVCEIRTDSINPLEKTRYEWSLRSKLGADFTIPGKAFKPYAWIEIINTLNAPQYQQYYIDADPNSHNGQQYIVKVRTQIGVRWRISKLSTLNFYYRFAYGYDRDINVTKKNSYVELTEEFGYIHSLGFVYELDW